MSTESEVADYVLLDTDRELAKRCRRAWDFGARERRNLRPAEAGEPDLARALKDALAIYYFPGMWRWSREIVQPLVIERLEKSLGPGHPERDLGEELLRAFFGWAPAHDDFEPVRVEAQFVAGVPDPARPRRGLATTTGQAISFRGSVDAVVMDDDGGTWLMEHHLLREDWLDPDVLRLDDRTLARGWGWRACFITDVTGELHNQLRVGPGDGSVSVRRTIVGRSRAEYGEFERRLAAEAAGLIASGVSTEPQPAPEHCAGCAYRAPCRAMNEGRDPGGLLSRDYEVRPTSPEPGDLGVATWSTNRGAAPPSWGRA